MDKLNELMVLQEANRQRPDLGVERKLLELRASAFARRSTLSASVTEMPQVTEGSQFELPKIRGDDLDIGCLRSALTRHGALHVREFFNQEQVARLRAVIDAALEAQDADYAGSSTERTAPWFEPSPFVSGGDAARDFVRCTGAVLAVDSPRGMYKLIEAFQQVKLDRLITEYFGERPAISAEKTTLRRVVSTGMSGGWHQDGRFLGTGIRSLNVWITLSDCGVDAPGLELVPTRLHRIVQTGDPGAGFDWCVAHERVEAEFPGKPIHPVFAAGDALFFDHFLLHRTFCTASMTQPRYAVENWFFAPSAYPASQTGLYI